jgi:hypothetical protein
MKFKHLFLISTAPLLLLSCGGERETEEDYLTDSDLEVSEEDVDDTPIETTYDELLSGEITEYRTVIFESFVAPLPSTMYFGDSEIPLHFYERRNQTAGRSMRVDVSEGSGNNKIESIPEEYGQEDLIIKSDA